MKFGTMAMIGFWLSALGGILGGYAWLRMRSRNPASPAAIRASLQRRLRDGELSEAEYRQRLQQLEADESRD